MPGDTGCFHGFEDAAAEAALQLILAAFSINLLIVISINHVQIVRKAPDKLQFTVQEDFKKLF